MTAATPITTIDIAGTAWPMYKLAALAGGLIVAVIIGVPTGSAQVAVLAAAAATVAIWSLGAIRAHHPHQGPTACAEDPSLRPG